jgi:hypothetical protein
MIILKPRTPVIETRTAEQIEADNQKMRDASIEKGKKFNEDYKRLFPNGAKI